MKAQLAANGIITLTTDFGHKGPFVATMKGMMLARFPAVRIIDLTHETDVHFPAEAGFWLSRSYRYFPAGTTHLAVVDPGVGTAREILCVLLDGHVFLAPDNGLLGPLAEAPGAAVYHLDRAKLRHLEPERISATFHGRDIFAPIGAELAAGRLQPADLGPQADSFVPSWVEEPQAISGRISGVVIAVDNFGNLISNIDETLIARFQKPVVSAGGRSFELLRTYGDTSPGDYLALINSFGVVEIARAEMNAAQSLGLGRGAPVTITEKQ